MSNIINNSIIPPKKDESKNDLYQKTEKDNTFLLDVQLLSSLKSIPGKIIPLSNKINEVSKSNNKENCNDKNKNDTNLNNNKSIFTPIDKSNNPFNYLNMGAINNTNINVNNVNNVNNIVNNNYTTNNFFLASGLNNTNINMNLNSFNNPSNAIGINYGFLDNPLLCSPSNHPSILSIKSDIKNNNFLWTDNKFSQNSFYFPNFMLYNNGNYASNENNINYGNLNKNNINNIINNNMKLSQLSYQPCNLPNQNQNGCEELLKKKRSNPILFAKEGENNINNINNLNNINNINNNNENNLDKKLTLLSLNNKCNENEKDKRDNNIEIDEEKEKNKSKKVFFNVENYSEESYEEEEDKIYHNVGGKSDCNNIFNCYHKKKKRRRKINEIRKFKCVHPHCEYSYKTLKQLQNHHYKMIPECQLDSVQILKLIFKTKVMLIKIIKKDKNKNDYFSKIYENYINSITLNNYTEFIAGAHFDDKIDFNLI